MRRFLLTMVFATGGFLAAPVVAAAANSPAHIVACPGFAGCFSPNPIQISVGSTVTWTNDTSPPHTATSDSGAWDTGTLGTGQTSAAISFNTPGTFAYHCNIHPNMHGSIVVTAAATATPAATVASTSRATAVPATRALAQSGGSPARVVALVLVVLGLALLVSGRIRGQRPELVRQPVNRRR